MIFRALCKSLLMGLLCAVAAGCGDDGGDRSSPTAPTTTPTAPVTTSFAPADQAAFESFVVGKNMSAEFLTGPDAFGPFPDERTYEFRESGVTGVDNTTTVYSYEYMNQGTNTGSFTINLGNDPGQDPFLLAFELSFTSEAAGTFEATFTNGDTGETSSLTGNFEFVDA